MKVWIVNPFDNTPMEGYRPQRYWLMARAFVRAGHEVVYWTSDFSHASKKRRELVRGAADGFAVVMVETLAYPRNVCLARVRSHLRLARAWKRMADECGEKPEVVIASMPPLGLCDAARAFAAECGAFFVADVQDAWPETFERILPGAAVSLLGMRRTARRIYLKADAVSAVARRYLELARKYGSDAPGAVFGHCIENGESLLPEKTASGEGLRLAYIGNMSMSYDLATLVKAVAGMERVTLDLAGDGPDRPRLESLVKSAGAAGNIRMHRYLAEEELKAMLLSCDAGVVPMHPDSCVGVPGKMADYAAAGLKIIECLGGETAEMVDRFGVGTHYRAGDVESLRAAITAAGSIDNSRGRQAFSDNFSASMVMEGFVQWVSRRCRGVGRKHGGDMV